MRLLIILAPVLLLLVLFTLSNRAPTELTFWPTDFSLVLPLSLVILAAMGLAFLLGGVLVWLSCLGQRRRARRAEQAVRLLEEQVQALKTRLPVPLPPPTA
jgi:putative membrane protein